MEQRIQTWQGEQEDRGVYKGECGIQFKPKRGIDQISKETKIGLKQQVQTIPI